MLIYYVYVIYHAGSLVPVNCAQAGLGGGVAVKIACSGCGLTIDYSSSAMLGGVHSPSVVSMALRLATFISGIGFAGYHKLFKRSLGMHSVTDKQFIIIIFQWQ